MTKEAYTFLCMAAAGGICAMIYDIFRALCAKAEYTAVIFITDIIYWVIASGVIIYALWHLSFLTLRWYEFAGLVLGAVIYFCTLSKIIYKIFLFIIGKIVKIIAYIFKIILTLRTFLYKITVIPVTVLCKQISKLCRKRRQI